MVPKLSTVILAVASVIASSTTPASAEVRYLRSPLTATGRRHACPGEILTFTCGVNGQFIRWNFNSGYRTTFFHDDNVNSVQVVSGRHGIRAILTSNDALLGNQPANLRSLKSVLIIDTPLSGHSHNISCSSHTATETYHLQFAEMPNLPRNVTVRVRVAPLVQQTPQAMPYTFSVTWEKPDNIENFDLEHFKIHAVTSEYETGIQESMNGTSVELEYHFDFKYVPQPNIVHTTVTAVSKCLQQLSLGSNLETWRQMKTVDEHFKTTVPPVTAWNLEVPAFNGVKELILREAVALSSSLGALSLSLLLQ